MNPINHATSPNPDYEQTGPSVQSKKENKKQKPVEEVFVEFSDQHLDAAIEKDLKLQKQVDKLMHKSIADDEFDLAILYKTLIDLGQALNGAATAKAKELNVISKTMGIYAEELSQVPTMTSADNKDKWSQTNTITQATTEKLRNWKALQDDYAKACQTTMTNFKDSYQSNEDVYSTTLDLTKNIGSKIMR